ncbi:YqaA family protein [Methylovirgula sp. 4M-Z18]|uniref:YqaA family protein n=1 Tax=Methylovirgula sp. 4M-Z18 TaxID=2293567 RepID=UPI000E2F2021|nr:YqaA family protein [Methylovirgula sp. 4M-Z18]RFB75541.1 DedA family protein [Methylovirgula sp. 4M-Z18]
MSQSFDRPAPDNAPKTGPFQRLYRWTLTLAESRHASYALAGIAFAESSFFPIPPDVILIPMSLAKPQRALFYALICTIASVLGGILGYAIGAWLYDTIGQWLIHMNGLDNKAEMLRGCYQTWGWVIILVKGITPIPFKLVTIVSGSMGYSLPLFILLAAITRGARFFLLAVVLNRWGEQIRALLDRYFAVFMVLLIAIIISGFWLVAHFGSSGGSCTV